MKSEIRIKFQVAAQKFERSVEAVDMAVTRKLLAYIAARERNLN